MLVYGERLPPPRPVGSRHFDDPAWNVQCPIQKQCEQLSVNNCNFSVPPVQFYKYAMDSAPQYYPRQYAPYVPPPRPPIFPNLPCSQAQQWEYNSMCYNVNGQPCQYTNVVDLEDFMNNEKRKEKSRVAARCRRTKEMQIFTELTDALPAKKEEVEQLDKASVMRLAISYLRVRDVVSMLPNVDTLPKLPIPEGVEELTSELSYMKALDGFVLVMSQQGDIVFCSENVADHLGVSQMEIMGQSVFEFSHPCDHDEIRDALRSNVGRRELLLRLKCTLTSKGRNVHLKSASYKVIHVTGHMLATEDKSSKTPERNNNDECKTEDEDKKAKTILVAVGRPIPHPSNIEIPLDSKTFLSKHSLDMKFTYTDEALLNTLGFEPEELVGRSLYDYQHAGDSALLSQQFKSLFSKGQCETGQYRFLAKTGGFAWVQTQATVITDKHQKPISVVCVNYVISGIECKDEVFAAHQVHHADLKPVVAAPAVTCDVPNGAIVAAVPPEVERPIPVTELIFAPRKKEMNKPFLMFSQDEGPTMLKDEPEPDLSHLAPTAGDACIPLENSPFDMFDEFILNDNYCSLLGDDLDSGSPVDSLTADSLLMSSPEPQENDSSCERSSLLTELSLDAFESGRSEIDIDDGHSPFIPTSDELPVLEPAVMWGALPDSVSQARPQPSEGQASPAPALQRLLAAPPTGPLPQDLITNIYSDQSLIPSRSVSSWEKGVKRTMKQEDEPSAKRVKRSPSPPQRAPAPAARQSSSVLMNLLDAEQSPMQVDNKLQPSYLLINSQKVLQQNPMNRPIPVPILNILKSVPIKQIMRTLPSNMQTINQMMPGINNQIPLANVMTPLSLNIGSSGIYSMPSSPNTPNYSPVMSPAQRDLVLSPYSTPQSLSPVGKFHQVHSPGNMLLDPYLTTKMQPSPSFPLQPADLLLDTNMPMASTDFWNESDVLQGTDFLMAFDEVKLN